jgi:hypothetical protein
MKTYTLEEITDKHIGKRAVVIGILPTGGEESLRFLISLRNRLEISSGNFMNYEKEIVAR